MPTTSSHTPGSPVALSDISPSARIAIYDDLKSIPRIVDINPQDVASFIEELSLAVYTEAKRFGGTIPYTVIREVSENFIHANFEEIIVSIFDDGNTIRFSDQGPGIQDKEKAQQPGFSSATQEMKQYIRGVGSGLPYVKEYLNPSGTILIEDNIDHGTVVTLSTGDESVLDLENSRKHQQETPADHVPSQPAQTPTQYQSPAMNPIPQMPYPLIQSYEAIPSRMPTFTVPLTEKQQKILDHLATEQILGITEISKRTGYAASSVHSALNKMEQAGLVEKIGTKRQITPLGISVMRTYSQRG